MSLKRTLGRVEEEATQYEKRLQATTEKLQEVTNAVDESER